MSANYTIKLPTLGVFSKKIAAVHTLTNTSLDPTDVLVGRCDPQ